MNIRELAYNGQLLDLEGNPQKWPLGSSKVSNDTIFGDSEVWLGRDVMIDAASIAGECRISDNVSIDSGAKVGSKVLLGSGVSIGEFAQIHDAVVVLNHSNIQPYAYLGYQVAVGPNVTIPAESQVGASMIIPNTQSIITLSRFGESNRTVTIHGSEYGPRYSIGCQDSICWETIRDRITDATETSETSADHYRKYQDIFQGIGDLVQHFYEASNEELDQIRQLRPILSKPAK